MIASYDIPLISYVSSTGPQKSYEYKDLNGYSIGFNNKIKSKLNDKLFYRSVCLFSKYSYQVDYNNIFNNSVDPSLIKLSTYKYYSLNFQIGLNYNFIEIGHFTLIPSLGFNCGYSLYNTVIDIYEDDSKNTSTSSCSIYQPYPVFISLQINFGIEYKISDRFQILIEPYLNYGVVRMGNEMDLCDLSIFGSLISINYKYK